MNSYFLHSAEANIEAGGFQIGKAIVGNGASGDSDCSSYVGKAATGRSDGCTHDHCTEAKNKARANLRLGVSAQCHKYISSTAPCEKFHC